MGEAALSDSLESLGPCILEDQVCIPLTDVFESDALPHESRNDPLPPFPEPYKGVKLDQRGGQRTRAREARPDPISFQLPFPAQAALRY